MAPEATKTRELNYLMVQHMGYSAETRLERHVRAGQRRQRFMLDNGRRLRDKGERFDEVSFDDVLKNHEVLLNGVRSGAIRVCRPDNLEALSLSQFGDLLTRLAEDFKQDLKVDKTLLEPLVGSNLKDEKVWVEKPKAEPKVEAPAAPAPKVEAAPPPPAPEPAPAPVHEEEEKKDKHPAKKGRR